MSNSQSIIAYPSLHSPNDFLRWWPELEPVNKRSLRLLRGGMGLARDSRDGYLQGPKAIQQRSSTRTEIGMC